MLHATAHGRIGRDTELRYTPDGTAVADIAIGCNYGRKGEDGKKPTQWIKATLWGKQAEALAEYLTKGKGVVAMLSDVNVRQYKSQDGTPGSSLEGRVDAIEFTGAGAGAASSREDARRQGRTRAGDPGLPATAQGSHRRAQRRQQGGAPREVDPLACLRGAGMQPREARSAPPRLQRRRASGGGLAMR
jgi:single-strand DNA-binding protein